jgi:hypothetical protein
MSRIAGARRIIHREPDYTVAATLTTSVGAVIPDLNCRIYLPRTVFGRPYLEFDLPEDLRFQLVIPEFSMRGHYESAGIDVSVSSEIVLTNGWREERSGTKFIRCVLPGEPWDLEVRIRRGDSPAESLAQEGVFRLTPNKLLNPALAICSSYTGEVNVQTARELSFQLPTATVRFRRYFSHEKTARGTLTTSELVAELSERIEVAKLRSLVEELDDLLLLVSLATRHRCVCRCWRTYDDTTDVRFYRNRLSAPRQRVIRTQETLIDVGDTQDFLKHTFPRFRENGEREALRQVSDLLVTSHEGTLESSFLKCFAALETLVAIHRRRAKFDPILEPEPWGNFAEYIRTFIRVHPLFKDETDRRKLAYEKIPELNRVAFGTAYRMCASALGTNGFHDDDLWPVVGSATGVSLAEIRNRLVHGVVFTPREQENLFTALVHLRWCVERMILAFLEWPLEHSLVGTFLRHMHPYNDWADARSCLTRDLPEQRVGPSEIRL